ncbi:hypothetical protein ABIA53_002042 [Pseudomonas monsensis]
MVRRVCLAIGVSTVTPVAKEVLDFAYLDGAVLAARSMGEWARRSGFGVDNVKVVDDGWVNNKPNPVTRVRVQQAVDELFPAGADVVDQLILSFCGHGLTGSNFGEIFWLFSDSLQMKYRIVVDRFYEEMFLLGVKRITLITDACREAPQSLELMRLDGSRGILVQGTRADETNFDSLACCHDGQLGYMVRDPAGAAPGKCIFSGVIADILWGLEPTAIENGLITTNALGKFARSRTAERAREYHLKLDPHCQVDPDAVVLYDTATPLKPPDDMQPWPSGNTVAVLGTEKNDEALDSAGFTAEEITTQRSVQQRTLRYRLFNKLPWFRRSKSKDPESREVVAGITHLQEDMDELHNIDMDMPRHRQMIKELSEQLRAESMTWVVQRRFLEIDRAGDANLIVWGEQATLLSNRATHSLRSEPPVNEFYVEPRTKGAPVLVHMGKEQVTPVVPYAGLYTAVVPSPNGDVFQVYGAHSSPQRYLAGMRTLREFSDGHLRADSVDRLAADLRHEKHADPMLGVICAYLYRALADYDNIRRMAYFYATRDQAVPFDIALLGGMEVTRNTHGALQLHVPAVKARESRPNVPALPDYATQETPAIFASVGGRCPWLGLGWDYVVEPRLESALLVEGLGEHASLIRRSGSTVLPAASARQLAEAWGLPPG